MILYAKSSIFSYYCAQLRNMGYEQLLIRLKETISFRFKPSLIVSCVSLIVSQVSRFRLLPAVNSPDGFLYNPRKMQILQCMHLLGNALRRISRQNIKPDTQRAGLISNESWNMISPSS